MLWFFLIIVVVLFFVLLVWAARRMSRGRRLAPASVKKYQDAWRNASAIQDDHRRVMEGEKVLDGAMTELGYDGTFADKLRKAGPRFSDPQQLWSAHKLRNRIAHEMGMSLSERESRSAMAAFERGLKDLY